MIWTAIQQYSVMGINFISGIVLARLLTPVDYGCIGMLNIFMVVAESFVDGGFGSALIQKKRPTQEDYSTVFHWNLVISLLAYLILYLSAPAIARYYNTPILSSVLRVQGVVIIIYAVTIIQRNILRKKLNFRKLSIVTIVTAVISLIVTIIMAYKGLGVWALVAQNILLTSIPSIVFWVSSKWRPSWTFSIQSFKSLFSFGFYMFLTHLINTVSNNVQGLLIGRYYSAETMGYYSKAKGTEKLASHSISKVMTQVTYPLYAEVQHDSAAVGNMIKRMTMSLSYVTYPLMFILILLAKPVFLLLYSSRWLPSVPYFQILCLAGLGQCLHSINLQSISAVGKSKSMFVWTVIKRIIGLAFIVGGMIYFGIKGLLVGMVLNNWFSYFVNISLVSKHIGYKWYRQLLDILPVGIASVVAFVVTYGAIRLIGTQVHLHIYVRGLIELAIYVLIYGGWSLIFKPEAYTYVRDIVQTLLNRFKHKKA